MKCFIYFHSLPGTCNKFPRPHYGTSLGGVNPWHNPFQRPPAASVEHLSWLNPFLAFAFKDLQPLPSSSLGRRRGRSESNNEVDSEPVRMDTSSFVPSDLWGLGRWLVGSAREPWPSWGEYEYWSSVAWFSLRTAKRSRLMTLGSCRVMMCFPTARCMWRNYERPVRGQLVPGRRCVAYHQWRF